MAKQSAAWRKKRAEVLAAAGYACSECGEMEKRLDVHHRYYEAGKAKWDYPNETLACLCPRCHGLADEQRRVIVRATGRLTPPDIDRACGYMDAAAVEHRHGDSIALRSYEYAQGVADFFAVQSGELIRTANHDAVSVAAIMAMSARKYMRDRVAEPGVA